MKEFFKEYIHLIGTIVVGLIFGLGFYYILLNAFHASTMSRQVYVNVNDLYYKEYQENLYLLKSNLNNFSYKNDKFSLNSSKVQGIYASLNSCYHVLNGDGAILSNKNAELLSYKEVYDLNKNFKNSLIDMCYISNISWMLKDEEILNTKYLSNLSAYSQTVDILSNNTSYIDTELRDNSSYYYNTEISNATIRNNLNSSYRLILKNYDDFSKIILELSKYLVGGDNNA